jgi:hypothetical protein
VPDRELEDFKTKIDLRQYAAAQGYELDRRESWRGSAVMRSGADKIFIKVDGDGHFVYFSVRDDQDNGSIIDFVQHRKRLGLGAVRKELRPWLGKASPALPEFPKLERTPKDRMRVEAEFMRMQDALRHPYLEERGLSPALLGSDRFAGRIHIDARNNAVFPHVDERGLCGYELKNRDFTGFAKGGEKGLWLSQKKPDDHRLVFAESGIDALSYAQLFPDEGSRYASIGGEVNPKQPDLIRAEISELPAGAEIIAAMDSDDVGHNLSGLIEKAVEDSGRRDLIFKADLPPRPGEDWNDVLRLKNHSFPTARQRRSI